MCNCQVGCRARRFGRLRRGSHWQHQQCLSGIETVNVPVGERTRRGQNQMTMPQYALLTVALQQHAIRAHRHSGPVDVDHSQRAEHPAPSEEVYADGRRIPVTNAVHGHKWTRPGIVSWLCGGVDVDFATGGHRRKRCSRENGCVAVLEGKLNSVPTRPIVALRYGPSESGRSRVACR